MKMEIIKTQITQYKTTDGRIFTDEDKAWSHERTLVLRKIFKLSGREGLTPYMDTSKKAIGKIVEKFDDILSEMYERNVLSKHYGTRDDF